MEIKHAFNDDRLEYQVLTEPCEGNERRWIEERLSGLVVGGFGVATEILRLKERNIALEKENTELRERVKLQDLALKANAEERFPLVKKLCALEKENTELRKIASALVPIPEETIVLSVEIEHMDVTTPEEQR